MKTVVIAGGGIIGLSAALELASRGLKVTVLEKGRVLEESSWAAAGMLAAGDPENPPLLTEFSRFSLARYPKFLARLQHLSGNTVRLRTTHTLQLCDSSPKTEDGRVLSPLEATQREPGVRIPTQCSVLWLEEQSLDPRELGTALAQAARAAGIDIREKTTLLAAIEKDEALALHTSSGRFDTDRLVVATGAWSGMSADGVLALPAQSVVPRKGQMLRIKAPAASDLETVLRSSAVYIVPRGKGPDGRNRLVVGATVEDAGFDRAVRAESTAWLLEQAGRLWTPVLSVRDDDIEEVWTGIRPATPDHLPVIGTFNSPYVCFATGHYRNGILLAPGTAEVVADLICGETPATDVERFSPRRFKAAYSVCEAVAAATLS